MNIRPFWGSTPTSTDASILVLRGKPYGTTRSDFIRKMSLYTLLGQDNGQLSNYVFFS
jgi:hypothetical protein